MAGRKPRATIDEVMVRKALTSWLELNSCLRKMNEQEVKLALDKEKEREPVRATLIKRLYQAYSARRRAREESELGSLIRQKRR